MDLIVLQRIGNRIYITQRDHDDAPIVGKILGVNFIASDSAIATAFQISELIEKQEADCSLLAHLEQH